MCCERSALALRHRMPASRRPRILCYHSTGTPRWGVNDVHPRTFRRHLEMALEAGFRFVPVSRIARGEGEDQELAISFDDGLRSVATHAAPVLNDLNIPWTCFVVTDWAEGKADWWAGDVLLTWKEIEALAAYGASIASHSVSHPRFPTLSLDQVHHELGASRDAIRARLGIDTTEFAIPIGRAKDWSPAAMTAAREAGYELVYAGAEQSRPQGTVPRTFVTRFDGDRLFRAALRGAFDRWEEWV